MQKVKCCYKNILESSTVTLSAGTEDSSYPLYRLYDRDIGKIFKSTAAETLEIKIDQGAINNITPDKLIIPKGHNLFTAGSLIDILVSNDNFVDESISLYRNLITHSEQIDNAAWVKLGAPVITANDTIAPDDQLTADKVTNLTISKEFWQVKTGLINLQRYEPSFYIKKISTSGTIILVNHINDSAGKWSIDLSAIGSDWERITRSHAAVTINNEFIGYNNECSPNFYGAAGTLDFHIWGIQLEKGDVSTNYISSISHNNEIIFDIPYSPINNLLKYSEQVNNAAWMKRGSVVITANDTTAPDGQVTADKVTGLGQDGTDFYQEVYDLINLQRYEPSFYIKKISSSGTLKLIHAYGGSPYGEWSIDLSAIGSGWERITRSHAAVTINNEFIGRYVNGAETGSGTQFISVAGTLDFYIWGVQMVEGTSPLEYQVTKSVAGYSPRRYIKIKIIFPSVIPQIPELFLTQTYTFEENPDDQVDDLDDVFNVENLVTAGGQDRFLEHGDPRKQRNYTCSLKGETQKTSILALNNAWRGNKPFWVCDHDGTWIFSKLKDPISLKREFENEDGGVYTFNLNILEVLP